MVFLLHLCGLEGYLMENDQVIKNNIDGFFEYFEHEVNDCLKLKKRLYKKILMVVMLDTLACSRYPCYRTDNHGRFTNLINNYADWEHSKHIDISQLFLMLKDKNMCGSKLAMEVSRQLENWVEGSVYTASDCPSYDDIITFASGSKEEGIVNKARFSELFYTYRNDLVHNYKEPGYGVEIEGDKEPIHHSMMNIGNKTELGGLIKYDWELVFPLSFIEIRIRNCLKNLKKYFEETKKNPYDSYTFNTMWLPGKQPTKH